MEVNEFKFIIQKKGLNGKNLYKIHTEQLQMFH